MTSRPTRAPATNRSRHGLSAVRPSGPMLVAPVTADCGRTRWIVSSASERGSSGFLRSTSSGSLAPNRGAATLAAASQHPRGLVAASSRCVRTACNARPHDRVRPEGRRRRTDARSGSGRVNARAVPHAEAYAASLDAPSPQLGLANEPRTRPRSCCSMVLREHAIREPRKGGDHDADRPSTTPHPGRSRRGSDARGRRGGDLLDPLEHSIIPTELGSGRPRAVPRSPSPARPGRPDRCCRAGHGTDCVRRRERRLRSRKRDLRRGSGRNGAAGTDVDARRPVCGRDGAHVVSGPTTARIPAQAPRRGRHAARGDRSGDRRGTVRGTHPARDPCRSDVRRLVSRRSIHHRPCRQCFAHATDHGPRDRDLDPNVAGSPCDGVVPGRQLATGAPVHRPATGLV